MKVPIVKEIQVCGHRLHTNLASACRDYLDCLASGIDREKIHFSFLLPNGESKSITIRQDGDRVIAYGDFEGLPNALEWAMDLEEE